MEGWRQLWRLGEKKNLVQQKTNRFHLTPTGLLMEGEGRTRHYRMWAQRRSYEGKFLKT
jgi:hypothetical protein